MPARITSDVWLFQVFTGSCWNCIWFMVIPDVYWFLLELHQMRVDSGDDPRARSDSIRPSHGSFRFGRRSAEVGSKSSRRSGRTAVRVGALCSRPDGWEMFAIAFRSETRLHWNHPDVLVDSSFGWESTAWNPCHFRLIPATCWNCFHKISARSQIGGNQ